MEYGDRVTFVTVYSIDAHPVGSVSPYAVDEWTMANSWDEAGNAVAQPTSYEERVALAQKTIEEAGITSLMLVDGMDNAVWAAYGPAPNAGYLIGRDGTIQFKQVWYAAEGMGTAIGQYLSGVSPDPLDTENSDCAPPE